MLVFFNMLGVFVMIVQAACEFVKIRIFTTNIYIMDCYDGQFE